MKILFDKLSPSLHQSLRTQHNPQDAADLAQASLERLLRQPDPEQLQSPQGWLRKIARNLHIDGLRQRKRLPIESLEQHDNPDSLPGLSHDFDPERILLGQERVQLLCAAIDQMPARCREAFILSRIHGLAHEAVADEMGISESMVEKHVALGIRICREWLEES